MGRPFQPASTQTKQNSQADTTIDELTLQWLQEHTQECLRCGSSIEKIEGGCDKMECLCGYRFCYACGSMGADCSCSPQLHFFWDNVLDELGDWDEEEEEDDDEDERDCANMIRRYIAKRNGHLVHKKRKRQRSTNQWERDSLDQFTSSARCLFHSNTNSQGIQMLEAYHNSMKLQCYRRYARRRYRTRQGGQEEQRELKEAIFWWG